MTDTSDPEIPHWRRVALALLLFLTTATIGFLQPFVPLYLEASHLSRVQIGWVAGMATGMALLLQPLLGLLSDRFDTRRLPMCLAAITAGCAYLAFRHAEQFWTFVLLSALGVNGSLYLGTAAGVLVGRMVTASTRGGSAYVSYRVWGSVGYIVISLLSGFLLTGRSSATALSRGNLAHVFLWGPPLFFLIAAVALFVPDPQHPTPASPAPGAEPQPVGNASPANLGIFLGAFFLYTMSLYGAMAYLALYLKSLGAAPIWVTATFTAGVTCEVLVMTRVGRWTDRFGRRPALAAAFLVLPARLLLYIPAAGPAWVLAVQTLHGLNFGIMGAIAVVFVNDLAANAGRGYAQSRLTAVQGLATAVGPIVCGWIAQQYGMAWMFAAMSAVGALGALIFLLWVQESHPSPEPFVIRGPALLQPVWKALASPLLRPSGGAETPFRR
jgi:MFS transporter, PPP family, 3-phenylpropionic acid transporter